jgi:hypothetical protein
MKTPIKKCETSKTLKKETLKDLVNKITPEIDIRKYIGGGDVGNEIIGEYLVPVKCKKVA